MRDEWPIVLGATDSSRFDLDVTEEQPPRTERRPAEQHWYEAEHSKCAQQAKMRLRHRRATCDRVHGRIAGPLVSVLVHEHRFGDWLGICAAWLNPLESGLRGRRNELEVSRVHGGLVVDRGSVRKVPPELVPNSSITYVLVALLVGVDHCVARHECAQVAVQRRVTRTT